MPDTIIKYNDQLLQWNRRIIRTETGPAAPVVVYPNVLTLDVSNNNPNEWIIVFDTSMYSTTAGWGFTINDVSSNVSGVSGNNTKTLVFTTTETVANGDALAASYNSAVGVAARIDTSVALQSFTDVSVNNTVEAVSYPTDNLEARWTWETANRLTDTINSYDWTQSGTITYGVGVVPDSSSMITPGTASNYLTQTGITSLMVGSNIYTISMWIKPPAGQGIYSIPLEGYNGTNDRSTIFQPTDGNIGIEWQIAPPAGSGKIQELSTDLNNQWNHVVVSHNGVDNTIKMWLNNNYVGQTTSIGDRSTGGNLNLGRSQTYSAFYDYEYDNMYFYSRELTNADVSTLYSEKNGFA